MSLDFAIITTPEQLAALPVGSVVAFPADDGSHATIYEHVAHEDGDEWWIDGQADPAILTPAGWCREGVLIWHPGWTVGDFQNEGCR